MITRFIALISICLFPLFANAQCAGTFTYQVNGLTVTFDGTVNPPPSSNTSYYWWFSDNNNSSAVQDPTYTFSGPGTYVVCFSVWDQTTQCSDSVCMPVTVGSGCNADFTAIDSMGYWYFLPTTTASQPATYFWDFGDGNNSSQQYPWHQYANPGTYTVCLTVYDANQNFCDSTCHVVVVQSQGGCTADFTSIDSLGYAFFFSNTTAGAGAMYFWDFGDGNYSSSANPSHVYANPGTYTVCLTVYDSMQNFCDSTCHVIQATTVGFGESNSLQASLTAAPNPADGSVSISFLATETGTATITFFDATGRIAAEQNFNVNSTGFSKSEFNTTNLTQGIYLVKIVVNNGSVANTRIAITHQSQR